MKKITVNKKELEEVYLTQGYEGVKKCFGIKASSTVWALLKEAKIPQKKRGRSKKFILKQS